MSLNTVISKRGCSKKFSVDLFSILSNIYFEYIAYNLNETKYQY